MTETTLNTSPKPRRFDLRRVASLVFHPRRELDRLAGEQTACWLAPMLVLCITLLLFVLAGGWMENRAAAGQQVELPPDWQYWTPEMQENFMQGAQMTRGAAVVYILPAVGGLIKLWLGWAVTAGLLHLISTLLGGRGSLRSALNLVAWSSLPFGVRDLLRTVFVLAVGHTIGSPGLSGFGGEAVFLAQLLVHLDIFLAWHALLLAAGLRRVDNLPLKKSVLGVIILLAIILLARAGLGALKAGLSGMLSGGF